MKKYIYSLFAAVLFLFSAGCSKDDDGSKNIDSGVVGEWRQTKWSNEAYADFDVYVEFLSDGTFNIFQKVETPTFVCYSGDFAVNGAQLSGRYRDGEPWGASYAFELSGDGKTLTMISQTDKAEESVYTRTAIPEEVRNAPEVRSALSGALLRTTLKSKSSLTMWSGCFCVDSDGCEKGDTGLHDNEYTNIAKWRIGWLYYCLHCPLYAGTVQNHAGTLNLFHRTECSAT